MTSKAARHIELRENLVREWVLDNTLSVKHAPGKVNPANIFTKEIRNGTHFCRLWDSMSCLSNSLQGSLLVLHHARQTGLNQVAPAAAQVALLIGPSSYFTALASSSFCQTLTTISYLSSASRQILWRLHGFVLLVLI